MNKTYIYRELFKSSIKGGTFNMAFNKVEICGVNTSKLPILNSEEKKRLLNEIKKGNAEAKQKYIYGNLRLVLSVIQRFANRGELMDDLFQVGCIGLIKAINNFDLSQNVQFSTYAVPMIVGEVKRYLRDNNSISVSRNLRYIAYRALQAKENLTNKLSREPKIDEIAKELNIDKADVAMALDAIQDPVSLYEPIFHDGGDTLYVMDQISDEKNKDIKWVENISISQAMGRLTDREKHILALRFFEGKTQTEVSNEVGISQAQVSRLEKSALIHMRKFM